MKVFSNLRRLALLLLALQAANWTVSAQGFDLNVSVTPDPVLVNGSLTYVLDLTNRTGFSLPNIYITNTPSALVNLLDVTNNHGTILTNTTSLLFIAESMTNGATAHMVLVIQPLSVGLLTNTIGVRAIEVTNFYTTNVVTEVAAAQADLGVTLTLPAQPVVVNDVITFQTAITNAGPDTAAGVVLTNSLPPGVVLQAVSPAGQAYSVVDTNLIFSLGALTNGTGMQLQFSILPTNAATLTFSAVIGAPDLLDSNPTNDTATASLSVINYLPADLQAVTNSAQVINPQNGLIEQSVLISNVGTNDAPAVRLVVAGLTNRLFNAVGTNSGSPYVVYGTNLMAGAGVNLLLQYSPRVPFPFTNGQLQPFAVPVPDLTPPPVASRDATLTISRLLLRTNGTALLEFPATPGVRYTVVYSADASFSNALMALPSFVAPASLVQWLDYGPPTTLSLPTNTPRRFYRVYRNP
ncbi:MAG TPA: DUF11 domain-containing protein [Dongiaceae bacterium]|nr:DUF11 domain-containing protein [Dongiaceae bacterium]